MYTVIFCASCLRYLQSHAASVMAWRCWASLCHIFIITCHPDGLKPPTSWKRSRLMSTRMRHAYEITCPQVMIFLRFFRRKYKQEYSFSSWSNEHKPHRASVLSMEYKAIPIHAGRPGHRHLHTLICFPFAWAAAWTVPDSRQGYVR